MTLDTYNYVQLKAFNTALPTGVRMVKNMRPFYTGSLVAMQPFYSTDITEPGGFVMGVNKTTKNLVFANRKKLKSPHGCIVGPTGLGKSFFIKMTEITRHFYQQMMTCRSLTRRMKQKRDSCTLWQGCSLTLRRNQKYI